MASAGIYTLIETGKANDINPNKYIHFILSDILGSAFLNFQNIWKTTCLGIHSYKKSVDSHFPNNIRRMAIFISTILFDAYVFYSVF